MKKLFFIFQICLFVPGYNCLAQNKLSFDTYISKVQENNIAYAVEKFNVSIAESKILSAQAFEDPELSIGYFDNGEKKRQLGYGYEAELEWKLELGGKRKARINLAKSEHALTQALLLNYFKNLKADATIAYCNALQSQKIFEVKQNSYEAMMQLAKSDSIRFNLGDISELNAKQSNVEALILKNEVFIAQANYKNNLSQLALLMGSMNYDFTIVDIFPKTANKQLDLLFLQNLAIENRTDLVVALQNKEVSKRNIELAKANRAIDLGLKLGMEYNSIIRNEIAETPRFTKIGGGVVIPLKFSNKKNSDLKIAKFELDQNERLYDLAHLEVNTEVHQTYNLFIANQKQVQEFNSGLLEKAKAVLNGKTYSYKRGETALLEVLDAQRTYNEIQEKYYETLFDYTVSLIELERVTGTQDILFKY